MHLSNFFSVSFSLLLFKRIIKQSFYLCPLFNKIILFATIIAFFMLFRTIFRYMSWLAANKANLLVASHEKMIAKTVSANILLFNCFSAPFCKVTGFLASCTQSFENCVISHYIIKISMVKLLLVLIMVILMSFIISYCLFFIIHFFYFFF